MTTYNISYAQRLLYLNLDHIDTQEEASRVVSWLRQL